MLKRFLFVFILTALLLGGLFGFKFYQIQQSISQMQPPPPAVVAVATVMQEIWPSSLSAIGSLSPVAAVDVSNEVAGKVKAIHFDSGHSVKAGQLLLELDAATDEAELQGLLAEQKLAQLRFDRASAMVAKKFLSQAELDQQHAELEQAVAAVNTKRTQIEKKRIHAPFAGELGMRQVDPGRYLEQGAAIVSLLRLDPIYLDFTLPERQLDQLAVGQQVNVTVQAYPGKTFLGTIQAVSPAIEQNTRALKVRASLGNKDKRLRPGMFAQVSIVSDQVSQVLTLPDTAITYNPYGNSVYLVVQDENGLTVQSRQVETGQVREGRVEITSGLNAGDRVVSAGQVKLRNGVPVTIDSKAAPGEREQAR